MATSKKIIVTRPEEDGVAFAQYACDRLNDISFDDFLFAPMLSVAHYDVQLPEFSEGDAVILTSAHAVRVFEGDVADEAWRDLPFYVVGDKCKTALLQLGAHHIEACAPNVSSLIDALPQRQDMRFWYLRGRDVSYDTRSALHARGQGIEELVCYEANMSTQITEECLQSIQSGDVRAITFFSQRTAQAFCDAMAREPTELPLEDITFLCISEKVADAFSEIGGQCRVARTADADGMIGLLKGL